MTIDLSGANLRQIFGNFRRKVSTSMQNDVTSPMLTTEAPEIQEMKQEFQSTPTESIPIVDRGLTVDQFWLVQNDTVSRVSNEETKFDRQFIERNERRKKSKNYETCNGEPRPELICANCKQGYPYYDCESKGKSGFKCKIECSSSKQHRPLTFNKRIKCRSTGWKRNYAKTIRCIESA